jgi:hypothetical protein
MKRLLIGVGLLIGMSSISHARIGMYGDYDGYGVYETTVMVNNQVNMFIATGNVAIINYFVLSTGTASGLIFQEATSNVISFGSPKFYGSSVPYCGNGTASFPTDSYTDGTGRYVMERSTMGWVVTKFGDSLSKVLIRWGYWK